MKGIYTLPAIPPHCKEVKTRVEVVRWLGNRVLLRDLDFAGPSDCLIETDLSSFQPDLEPYEHNPH